MTKEIDSVIGCGQLAAVQGHQVKLATEAANRNLGALALDAVDGHAGNALQRFGQVGVGELTNIFRGNGVHYA